MQKLAGLLLALGIVVTVGAASCATGSETGAGSDDDGSDGSDDGSGGSASTSSGKSASGSGASMATSSNASSASVASVGSGSSSSGFMCTPPVGACDEFTCIQACFMCFQIGCCISDACVCQDIMTECPTGSSGSGGTGGV